jgi:MFS family permease
MLCLAWGIVSFEYAGINFLLPFIAPDLKLSNAQIGILVSVFWLPFGLSSYLTGELSDRAGRRKRLLVITLLVFSVVSILSGFATSFRTLLAARMLMGFLEGPILPLAQSIIALEIPVERRAMKMGIVQTVGSGLLSGFAAPLVLVDLAVRHGWRAGFFVVAVPGLICACLLALFLSEPANQNVDRHDADPPASENAIVGLRDVLHFRNIWLCSLLSLLFVAYALTGLGYLPLFYTTVKHLPPNQMSMLMSVLGVAGMAMGTAVPAAADRIGRKPAAVLASLLGLCCPLAALYLSGPLPLLALLMFVGWAPVGASILYMATIPSESVPTRSISTAIGLTFAVGTLLGGGAGPSLAGWAADHWGLQTSLLLDAACAGAMALIALGLRETRPAGAKVATNAPSPPRASSR